MILSRRLALAAVLVFASAGCGKDNSGTLSIAVMGSAEAMRESGVRLSPAAQLLRGASAEGLVGFDAEGRVVPALADRWIITDDGQSYIFRLRDGNWPDGKRITADTTASLLRRTLTTLRGTALGLDLAVIREVRVMTDRVIEIDLQSPVPDLLTLLAQPELGLTAAKRAGGPMALQVEGTGATLTLIPPEKRGLPAQPDFAARARPLLLEFASPAKAVARFNDGYVDAVLGGRIDSLPLAGRIGLARGNVQLDPVIGLFGLTVESAQGFLGDAANREALAMAIDREALLGAFNIGGWQPTTRVVSPDVDGDLGTIGERWGGMTIAARKARAAERVAAWKAAGRDLPELGIAMPDGPGSQLVFEQLRIDFAAVGLTVRKVPERAKADLRLVDSVARYGRATWFLNQLSCTVQRAVCSPIGDERVAEARAATDPQARAALLAEAEAEITGANGYIPIARPLRWSLVRSGVTGFAPNPWGWHPLPPLAMLPK